MVRGLAPTLVNQGSATIFTEPNQEPVDLPYTDRQHNGRRGNCPSARKDLCQNLHASHVLLAHEHPTQSRPPPRRRYCWEGNRTFLSGRGVTFLSGANRLS